MSQIVTYSFGDDFIERLSTFLHERFLRDNNDLSRVACIFGGRRPALFVRRALSQRIGRSFIPPAFFSIDEFIDYLLGKQEVFSKMSELDAQFFIYTIVQKSFPRLIKGRERFSSFMSWAGEIISFIEQLDLEGVDDSALLHISKSAAIGYDVPPQINELLKNLKEIRAAYHCHMRQNRLYSRGMRYALAADTADAIVLDEFDAVVFCNFFYLHAKEKTLLARFSRTDKTFCIFQGSQNDWSVLEDNARTLAGPIIPAVETGPEPAVFLYRAFDLHSQVCTVREVLQKIPAFQERTVIVLPRPESVLPLLAEISCFLGEHNISLGYPVRSSTLYALFDALFKAQGSRKDGAYYAKDYLNLLRHPLVKNFYCGFDAAATRVIVHKLEELLEGIEESSISGSLFVRLDDIEAEEKLFHLAHSVLSGMDENVSLADCRTILSYLHRVFYTSWENISTFEQFADALASVSAALLEQKTLMTFPLNLKIMEAFHGIRDEILNISFSRETFVQEEIFKIFRQILDNTLVSFVGSPLKGIQILGLFETRSLNFDNVIIMDVNESILPRLAVSEPLIPREVMLSLGLNRLEKEEEIQRYQFMRLVKGAKEVHLIYAHDEINEKSRFIEELLWQQQKKKKNIAVTPVVPVSFEVQIGRESQPPAKTGEIIEFLKQQRFSASRLNTYLYCPLQFYYQYVLGLREQDEILDDPQAHHIGTFVHTLLEDTFKRFIGKKPVINAAFRRYFLKKLDDKFDQEIRRRMKSDSFLLHHIFVNRLKKFLKNEETRDVARIVALEEERTGKIDFTFGPVEFVYKIDRIDELENGEITVIDYKTGSSGFVPKRFSALRDMAMTRETIKDSLRSFQLPLYYHFVSSDFTGRIVNAELYNIRTLVRDSFISQDDQAFCGEIIDICLHAVAHIIGEILDPRIPFVPDKDLRRCRLCAFGALCG